MLSEREDRLQELEMTVERLQDNAVDSDSLLESMQSDKTALSRAIAQNKELKTQLAELQNGFVKMVCVPKDFQWLVSICSLGKGGWHFSPKVWGECLILLPQVL